MKRDLESRLLQWRLAPGRKPLIVRGARQTGKTYLLTEFGETHFAKLHRINFQEDPLAAELFEGSLDPRRLISALELYVDDEIELERDLLFLDEIQDCPRALTSLKFFCEQLPELAVCAAGSLLGVVHADGAFPVGKVQFLDLHPLSFLEFLAALSEHRKARFLRELTAADTIPEALHRDLMELFRLYLVVGGMPEVVSTFARERAHLSRAFKTARQVQRDLLSAYVRDFAKYGRAVRADRILAVFEGVPAQLAKPMKKFVPSTLKAGARHATFESAIDWLVGAGLVHKVPISSSGELPFSAFTRDNRFKLYALDVGLLGALADLSPAALFQEVEPFATFRGAFCENFVAQELIAAGRRRLFSWASQTKAEVEFVLEHQGRVLPIEVKAGLSGKLKSLNVFADRYGAPYRTRISARNLEINEAAAMHSYPLYLAGRFPLPFGPASPD